MKKQTPTKADIINKIKTLPLLAECASRLINTIHDPDHDLATIVKIIESDAALTTNILKAANSAYYGFPQEICSVNKAISLMGEEAIINITLTNAADSLLNTCLDGYESSEDDLWRHNLFTAISSKKMALQTYEKTNPAMAFTAGLLHDIGKTILSKFLGNTSNRILHAIEEGKVSEYQEAERRIMGIDHANAGYEIAKHWNLPHILQNAIKFHHKPHAAPHEAKPLAYCVHLSDMMAMMEGFGTGADALAYQLDDQYNAYIELSKNQLALILLETESEFQNILSMLK